MTAGQRDPQLLAALARTAMKARHDDLVQTLDGMSGDHHGELAGILLDQIAFLDQRIAALSAQAARRCDTNPPPSQRRTTDDLAPEVASSKGRSP
jgi:hypothetical protein